MIGWTNAWNTIIRQVIFKDTELKDLMKLPGKTNIVQFTDRYFIRAGFSNKLLTDEICRIVYADTAQGETAVPNVKRNIMTFDIFVKDEEMYNIGKDRLVSRLDYIADRLYKLLTQKRYLQNTGYRFWIAAQDLDLGTKTVGYSRKTIAFYYMKVY